MILKTLPNQGFRADPTKIHAPDTRMNIMINRQRRQPLRQQIKSMQFTLQAKHC